MIIGRISGRISDIRPAGYPVPVTGYPAGYRIAKKAGYPAGYPAGRISGATLVHSHTVPTDLRFGGKKNLDTLGKIQTDRNC